VKVGTGKEEKAVRFLSVHRSNVLLLRKYALGPCQ
jgi:hypothetical protein